MAGPKFVPLGEQLENEEEIQSLSTQDKVITLINQAQLVSKEDKLECLARVRELIINKEPSLLDNFFEEVTAFHQESSVDIKKFVVAFIEDACKKDSHLLVRAIPMLRYILSDRNSSVQKRVIVCFMQLYKIAISYILKLKTVEGSRVTEMWEALQESKKDICDQLDGENDGIRTLVIKFIEMVILAQTKREQGQPPCKPNEIELSIDMIPIGHPVLKTTDLREEAGTLLRRILELTTSPDVSSVNLMTCISTLCTVARQRPIYVSTVIQTFEILHGNLPPQFSSSQINSVTKHLKSQLLALLKQSLSYEFHPQLVTLLTALGCSQSDINKNTPKRPRCDNEGALPSKKHRIGGVTINPEEDEEITGNAFLEAVDMTTTELKELLTLDSVVELVIENMHRLPELIPTGFRCSYTPIAAAGTDAQITQTARLLASQMTSAGLGIGAVTKGIQGNQMEGSPAASERLKKEKEESEEVNLEQSMEELHYLGSLLGLPSISDPLFPLAYTNFFGSIPGMDDTPPEPQDMDTIDRANLVPIQTSLSSGDYSKVAAVQRKESLETAAPQKLKKIKVFDLSSIVKPMSSEQQQRMGLAAFKRILEAEKTVGHNLVRTRLIIRLTLKFGGDYIGALYEFIMDDFKAHFDLAVSWLYAVYSVNHGYRVLPALVTPSYDKCLTTLLKGAYKKLDVRDRLFTRLLIEAPVVTPNALAIVRTYCKDEDRAFLGLSTIRDLIIKKPQGVNDFLDALLEVTMDELELARVQALHIVKKFYSRNDLSQRIERYAVQALQNLLTDHPSFHQHQPTDIEAPTEWTEESAKICMGLFLTLLPMNCKLLKELAIVYTNTSATVKRILLKLLDQPVRVIGMHSPELLELVETCPKGAETLIMRILYILTENAAPSPELVKRVRELYQRSSSDVRFLIPVLHGLTKQEVLSALPKFIRLSPNVTKGVFERLLVSYKAEGSQLMSPVSPSELMIALHTLDCKGDDALMKAVVRATNLCFQEKAVYTQEVLAMVLQQLVDHTPLPLLFMRTVIQSLKVCPRLINFVMTILTKLISKQIWKLPKMWQGFIKCCEATVPHSYQVIVQLPPKQLESLLKISHQLRGPFLSYVLSLTTSQKASIPRSVLTVVEKELQRKDEDDEGTSHSPKRRKLSGQDQ